MNFAYLHLLLNHLPVLCVPMATLFLCFAMIKKNFQMVRFSLVVLFFSALTCAPAFFTGEPAEKQIEDYPAVRESINSEHEEAGEFAVIVSGLVAVTAAFSFFLNSNKKYYPFILNALVILAVFNTSVLFRTAYLGGHIRHTEARGKLF